VTAVRDLLADLGHAHDFAGAPCIGRWAWFDGPGTHEAADQVAERHEAARRLCGTCPLPTFARCAATARALPKAQRRGGWAGRSYDTTSNPQQPRPPPRDPNHSPPNRTVRPTSLPRRASPC